MNTFNFINPFPVVTKLFRAENQETQYYAKPCSSFGYYRGSPIYGGDGGTQGPQVRGVGKFPIGQGVSGGPSSDWTPTHTFLILLLVAELFIYSVLCSVV